MTQLSLSILEESISMWTQPPFVPEIILILCWYLKTSTNPVVTSHKRHCYVAIALAKAGMAAYTLSASIF